MVTHTRRRIRPWLPGLACLLALGLTLARPALAAAAACADGFALWANSATRSDALEISGSGGTIGGAVRSNAGVKLGGSGTTIAGAVTYATRFEDGGGANSYPGPARAAPAQPPLSYDIASYRPGGAAALAALAEGRYTVVRGDLEVSEPSTLSGLYYVSGTAKLAAGDLRGAFTIVAEQTIEVSGSGIAAAPYADGLLLFANRREPGGAVLKLAGGDSELRGVIYAPRGMVELSGSDSAYVGTILGDTLKLAGSGLRVDFAAGYCPGSGAGSFAPDEVVVKLRSAADLATVIADHGLDPAVRGQFGARPIYRLGLLGGEGPRLVAARLAGDPRVEYAEPNYLAQDPEGRRGRGSWVVGDSAGAYAEQWAPARIRLPEAHARSRGAGVTVAVLDTGVDLDHPALQGRLGPGFDFVDLDADPREEGAFGPDTGYGHGTHVTGLVALAAPDAMIMPVRVLDEAGVGNLWVLAEALLFAVERGPDGLPLSGDEAQVVNLSLGTLRPTHLLGDLVAELACATDDDDDDDDDDGDGADGAPDERCRRTGGAVVVAAAGNGGDATPQFPAAEAVPGSLALGASTSGDLRADFSTYGPWVRLAAPGETIVSTVPGGAYGTWSGTSMAAPLAAGVAALVRSAEPGLDARAVTERLVDTGAPIPGLIPRRLDAAAALGAPAGPVARP